MKLQFIAVVVAGLASASVAAAQQGDVPANIRPPAGMCRIWLNGVPPAQQPAPTDCATAVKNRPQNGRVIFGDDYVSRGNSDTAKKMSEDYGVIAQKSMFGKKYMGIVRTTFVINKEGRIVRIAHMGSITRKDLDEGIQILEETLKEQAAEGIRK